MHGVIYKEDEFLQLSGIQHFAYCRRQWALIHIEQQWMDNLRTVDGQLFHQRSHNETIREKQGNILRIRGLSVASQVLGISGKCDVVEFRSDPKGVVLSGEEGVWLPYPVEYKRGQPKPHQADELQLCAQAMCLEEMLCCTILEGALFYGETRRRSRIEFTQQLRQQVIHITEEMHQLFRRGYTPEVKIRSGCSNCSLKDLCLPALRTRGKVTEYLYQSMEEKE